MRRVDNANQSAGGAGSFDNYQFDFGLGNGLNKGSSNAPLKDQKQPGFGSPWSSPQVPKPAASQSAASSGWSAYQASAAGWSSSQSKSSGGSAGLSTPSSQTWGGGSKTPAAQTGWEGYQPMTQGLGGANKPAAAAVGGVGGLRSMNAAPMNPSLRSEESKLAAAGIAGIAQNQKAKGDDVFGDLFGEALNRSNAPLNSKSAPKTAPKTASKTSFSMGKLDSSLPKTGEKPTQPIPMARMAKPTPAPPAAAPAAEPVARRPTQSSAERDPFPPVSASSNVSYEDDIFSFPGGAPSASAASTAAASQFSSDDPFGLSGSFSGVGGSNADPFEFGGPGKSVPLPQRVPGAKSTTPMADPFDVFKVKSSPSTTRKPTDPLDSLLSRSAAPTPKPAPPAPVQDDGWGVFGGDAGGSSAGNEPTTTELEGLPPPPPGVTAMAANDKGSEFYKNGQYPDAIKWLSWSIELLKGSPDKMLMLEVLSCRVSCYKEIGEMKKAVADCSQAIDLQPTSTSLIMLRSNLYESMEKYKLGVADLKLVLKIDRDHRQARATLTRLERMVG